LLWHQFRLMAVNALVSGKQAAQDAERRRRPEGTAAAPDAYERAIAQRLEGAQGTPTGATATIAGRRCQEYRYSGVAYDNSFVLAGTYWIPDNGPGADEYRGLYKKLDELTLVKDEEAGVGRGRKRAVRGQAELQREFMVVARRRGIPYRFEYEITGKGMGGLTVSQELLSLSTARVPAGTFTIPQGYKLRK